MRPFVGGCLVGSVTLRMGGSGCFWFGGDMLLLEVGGDMLSVSVLDCVQPAQRPAASTIRIAARVNMYFPPDGTAAIIPLSRACEPRRSGDARRGILGVF